MNTTNETAAAAPVTKLAKHVDLGWFKAVLDQWPTQWAGSKPTSEMLATALLIDRKRPGFEALHIAMCLRPNGCTVQQFTTAGSCGPANNHRRALAAAGLIKVAVEGKPYAYIATVTAKGQKAIERHLAAVISEAAAGDQPKAPKTKKAAKAKSKGKGAGNAPAATTPTASDVPPTSEAPSPAAGQTGSDGAPHSGDPAVTA